MHSLPDGMVIMSAEEIYGPGLFTGKLFIDTALGRAEILSTDWATVLKEPKQMALLKFWDGKTKMYLEDDSIFWRNRQ